MNPYKTFLRVNKIKQVELANFLSVTEPAISNIVNGKANMSEENLLKVLQNDRGWDVSMLSGVKAMIVGDGASGVVIGSIGAMDNSTIDNRHYYSDSPDVLKAQIELLDERIKEKDAQIKEKDAQIKQLLDILAKK